MTQPQPFHRIDDLTLVVSVCRDVIDLALDRIIDRRDLETEFGVLYAVRLMLDSVYEQTPISAG